MIVFSLTRPRYTALEVSTLTTTPRIYVVKEPRLVLHDKFDPTTLIEIILQSSWGPSWSYGSWTFVRDRDNSDTSNQKLKFGWQ